MRRTLAAVLGVLANATMIFLPVVLVTGGPVPPACVVVDKPPLHLQIGYAPDGPDDCTAVPTA